MPGVSKIERPIGTEIIYDKKKRVIYIKVSNKGYTHGLLGTWKRKHIFLWEQQNGPLPENHKIIFADKNRYNFSLDNLVCVSDSVYYQLLGNGYFYENPELTKAAIATIEHRTAINGAIKRKEKSNGKNKR